MAEDKQYKRKIKPGVIELDPVEPVIIVHYDTLVIDQQAEGDDGEPKIVQRKASQRRIKLRTFKANSTISKFANEIVDKCKYIHSSKVGHVSNLLEQLKERIIKQEAAAGGDGNDVAKPAVADDSDDEPEVVREQPGRQRPGSAARSRPAKPAPDAEQEEREQRHQEEEIQRRRQEQERKEREEQGERARRAAENAEIQKEEAAVKAKDDREAAEAKMRAEIEAEMKAKYEAENKVERDKLEEEKKKAAAATAEAQETARKAMVDAQAQVRAAMEAEKKLKDQEEAEVSKGKKKKDKKRKKLKLRGAPKSKSKSKETAKMDKIESYLEKLYEEDIQVKIKGTAMLLQLVQHPQNLAYFIESDTILGALSRVLVEDRKKSTELVTNILEIFFCFSSFTQLHPILLHNKIGDTTMKIVDLEIKRYSLKTEKEPKKMAKYLQKQERLLFVCFYILLNLAEDHNIEIKMINRSIIKHLAKILDRKNPDRKFIDELHLLIVSFLKRLSIFTENKADMFELEMVKKLLPFMSTDNEDLLEACLRLLYNLSFDSEHRTAMVQNGMVPMFCEFLKAPVCRQVSVQILYNLSTDLRHKEMCDGALVGAVPLVTQLIIQCPNQLVEQELIALAINMSNDPQSIDMMVAGDGLHHMIKRVFQTHDPLLIKLIRNISDFPQYRPYFEKYLHELAGASVKTSNHDFLVESLATLANITTPGVAFNEVIMQHNMVDFLMKHMVPGFVEDDIVLQVVMLFATMANDFKAGPMLGNARLARMLYDVINEKHDDVDIVLQAIYTIFKLLLQPQSRSVILKHEMLTNKLLDYVVDPVEAIRHYANMSLDIIMEFDEEWRGKILEKRFEASNREWIEFMSNGGVPPEQMAQDYDEFYDTQYGYAEEQHPAMWENHQYINDMGDHEASMAENYHPGMENASY